MLIDDLVSKGIDEPYRMFTARAEYRILLRQDNADERLTPFGENFGTVSKERTDLLSAKQEYIIKIITSLKEKSVSPEKINSFLEEKNTAVLGQKTKAINVALRPQVSLEELLPFVDKPLFLEISSNDRCEEILESAEIQIKYDGYIQREKIIADKIKRLENVKIPDDIEFDELTSISTEGRQKLSKIRPSNIGQASRITGVSPSDVNVLLMYLGR